MNRERPQDWGGVGEHVSACTRAQWSIAQQVGSTAQHRCNSTTPVLHSLAHVECGGALRAAGQRKVERQAAARGVRVGGCAGGGGRQVQSLTGRGNGGGEMARGFRWVGRCGRWEPSQASMQWRLRIGWATSPHVQTAAVTNG